MNGALWLNNVDITTFIEPIREKNIRAHSSPLIKS